MDAEGNGGVMEWEARHWSVGVIGVMESRSGKSLVFPALFCY